MNYVCGYMFSPDKSLVALTWKNRPDWQKGKLNGIGGKIEPEDVIADRYNTPLYAMRREFFEETGVRTFPNDWELFATVSYCDGSPNDFEAEENKVYYFRSFSDKIFSVAKTTDEVPIVIPVTTVDLFPQVNHNQWLLPMALNSLSGFIYDIREYDRELQI